MIDKLQHFITVVFRDIPTSFLVGFLVSFCVGTILFLFLLGWKRGARWSAGVMLGVSGLNFLDLEGESAERFNYCKRGRPPKLQVEFLVQNEQNSEL